MALEPLQPAGSAAAAPRTTDSVVDTVRRYWWFTAIVLVASLGATYLVTKQQTETYSASSRVLLRTEDTLALFPLSSTAPRQLTRSTGTEQFFTTSPEFRDVVQEDTPEGVRVSSRTGESALIFTARGPKPDDVAAAANLWAETYVVERHNAFVAEQQEDLQFIQGEVSALENRRSVVREELDLLEALIEETTDTEQLSRLLVQKVSLEASLQNQLDPIESQISSFRQQLSSFEFIMRFLESDDISARVVSPASVPTSPVSPSLTRNLAVGGFLGAAVGFGVPFARRRLSDKVDERDDVVDAAALPVLSAIPSFEHDPDHTIEVLGHPSSSATEHYQALLTAIEFAATGERTQSIFFTSAESGEGKSTTAINVAALAAQYLNVLVVDADMRRPSLHTITGADNSLGLADILSGKASFREVRQRFERRGTRFDIVPAGRIVDDPALLLRGDAWSDLLEQMFLYDMIIVDGPPVLAVTDALLIGRAVDAQVLLVRWGKTGRKTLAAASELLSTNGARTLGAVVNRATSNQGGYQYYGTYRSDAAAG